MGRPRNPEIPDDERDGSARARRSRNARDAAGWRQVNVHLPPEAIEALQLLEEAHGSKSEAIAFALIRIATARERQ